MALKPEPPYSYRVNIFDLEYTHAVSERLREDIDKSLNLNQIDLSEAANLAEESAIKPDAFFQKSGMKALQDCILKVLGPEIIDSFLLEFLKLKSSTRPLYHLAYWAEDEAKAAIKRPLIEEKLRKINKFITREGLNIFYHKGFFAAPAFPMAYFSHHHQPIPEIVSPQIQDGLKTYYQRWETFQKSLGENPELIQEDAMKNGYQFELKSVKTDSEGQAACGRIELFIESYHQFIKTSLYSLEKRKFIPDPIFKTRPDGKERGVRFFHRISHEAYQHCFLEPADQDLDTWFLSIPLVAMPANKKRKIGLFERNLKADNRKLPKDFYVGQGAIFCFLKLKPNIPKERVVAKLKPLIGLLTNIAKDISYNALLEDGLKLADDVKEHALRASFAAIISRNGSHNIGSHVLSSMEGNFQDLPDTHELFAYIQERFDFLAQVTTDFPEWTFPVRFFNDLMHRFYKQRLLLDYIADTEKLKAFEFQEREIFDIGDDVIKPHTRSQASLANCSKKLLINSWYIFHPKDGIPQKTAIVSADTSEKIEIEHDVLVAIPGGIVGYHAVFIILENIIRNASKYGWGTKRHEDVDGPKNLEINIELHEYEAANQFVEVCIWDNVSNPTQTDRNGKSLVDSINTSEKLFQPFIDRKGEYIKSNLGLAEMRIASGFLNLAGRNIIGEGRQEEIQFRYNAKKPGKGHRGIISAYEHHDETEGKKYLGYKFPIPKPKETLIQGSVPDTLQKRIHASNHIRTYLQIRPVPSSKTLNRRLDTDFMVFYDTVEHPHPLFERILALGGRPKEDFGPILDDLDTFPGRLILLSDRIEAFRAATVEKAYIVTNRIAYLHLPQLEAYLADESAERLSFYNFLYLIWIRHLRKANKTEETRRPVQLRLQLDGTLSRGNREIYYHLHKRMGPLLAESIVPDGKFYRLAHLQEQYGEDMFIARCEAVRDKLKKVKTAEIQQQYNTELEALRDSPLAANGGLNYQKLREIWLKLAIPSWDKQEMLLKDWVQETLDHYIQVYLSALKPYLQKYPEYIETLPIAYRADTKVPDGQWRRRLDRINYDLARQLPDEHANEEVVISYTRHEFNKLDWYAEALSGAQIYFSTMQNILRQDDAFEQYRLYAQLVENGLLRMLIADERVHRYYRHKDRERLRNTQIEVPQAIYAGKQIFDLESLEIYEYEEGEPEELHYLPYEESYPSWNAEEGQDRREFLLSQAIHADLIENNFEVLIFHQGILDKLFDKESEKVEQFIRACKLRVPFVAVTSGRGEPDNLPRKTKFIPYSNLQTYIMRSYPEKLLFTQVLMKASDTPNTDAH